MENAMDLRLIQEFSGDGFVNVIEWLEKAELVCALRGITRLEAVLPLRLTGGAFAVYQQLTAEDKADSGKIKFALKTAFAVDAFTAYELFVARRLQPGETVDVYLAELRRLAVPFGGHFGVPFRRWAHLWRDYQTARNSCCVPGHAWTTCRWPTS